MLFLVVFKSKRLLYSGKNGYSKIKMLFASTQSRRLIFFNCMLNVIYI